MALKKAFLKVGVDWRGRLPLSAWREWSVTFIRARAVCCEIRHYSWVKCTDCLSLPLPPNSKRCVVAPSLRHHQTALWRSPRLTCAQGASRGSWAPCRNGNTQGNFVLDCLFKCISINPLLEIFNAKDPEGYSEICIFSQASWMIRDPMSKVRTITHVLT